ncbi:MAG: hypothetical protein B5M51_04915 [Anaerolinea sp. 4484_236]|nr:MAG: hypothetical protein B5M51_04915 [Anaerolinea sp. 4484_236]
MKSKLIKNALLLVILTLIASSACSSSDPETPEPEPTTPIEPTAVVVPVEEVASPTPLPTEPVAQQFYTEEFDTDTGTWTYFLIDANRPAPLYVEDDFGTMFIGIEDGRLLFSLESEQQWTYVTYDAYEYDNVRIDIVAENRGVNNNNVSLICRYTDEGWYEYNVANNGLYDLYYAFRRDDNKIVYNPMASGGSNKIKVGREINEYTMICNERTLKLYINGNETNVYEDNQYVLRDGLVGVGVSSFFTLPVKVEIDSVTISEP